MTSGRSDNDDHQRMKENGALKAQTPPHDKTSISRGAVEDFLYAEAELLDSWKLDQWLELFDAERGCLYMPSTSTPNSDSNTALYLIADDMPRLRSRVSQLMSGLAWAENPKSRTNHMITNVRISGRDGDMILVKANFVVYRIRFEHTDPYIGKYYYKLLPVGQTFKIIERRVVLDLESLRPHGKVSFIV